MGNLEVIQLYNNFDRIYGPYERKDGRSIIILIKYDKSTKMMKRRTVSYPKYIVESNIGRLLDDNETVDHIDGDFRNNDLSNLRVVDRSEHCRSHVDMLKEVVKQCKICGMKFTTRDNTRILCGNKQCTGRSAHINGHNRGNSFTVDFFKSYESNRCILDKIDSVADQLRKSTS